MAGAMGGDHFDWLRIGDKMYNDSNGNINISIRCYLYGFCSEYVETVSVFGYGSMQH